MIDVIIDIKSTQNNEVDSDTIELTTIGKLMRRNDSFLLSYEENKTIKDSKVKTVIKSDGKDRIVMMRSGAIDSRMIIEKSKRHRCFYTASQGELVLGIFGYEISNSLSSEGGKIKMKYSIDIENDFISKNTVEINVRRIEN